MAIETVLGRVDVPSSEYVSMHEHVFGDFPGAQHAPGARRVARRFCMHGPSPAGGLGSAARDSACTDATEICAIEEPLPVEPRRGARGGLPPSASGD